MSVLTRRAFVGGAVAGAGTFALHAANARATTFLPYPFTLGVASGDPVSDGIVLWTRLAPKPLEGGGMPRLPIPVLYEIAEDERCRRVVRRGIELALPEHAHTVHADVRGLKPGREYFYRFIVGRHDSPIGRTVTAPSLHGSTKRLRFAFASCQDWQNGYYSAYGDMAKQDLDLVVHLGDYIYEYAADPAGRGRISATRSSRSRATATVTRSTAPTPSCRPSTRASRSSSRPTTTRSRTTTRMRSVRRAPTRTRSRSRCGAPTPTAPTGSTCRCAPPSVRAVRTSSSTAPSTGATWRPSRSWTRASTAPINRAGTV